MKRWINVKTTKNWRLPIEAKSVITPRKFNIAPKKRQSQKQTHLPTIIFSGAMLNFGGVVVSGNFHGNKEQKLSGLEYQYSSHSSVDGFNPYVPGSKQLVLGMVTPPLIGIFYNCCLNFNPTIGSMTIPLPGTSGGFEPSTYK